MLGGGFLKQAHDSFMQNREMRKDATKLASKDILSFKAKTSKSLSDKDPIMTVSARALLVQEIKRENRRDMILTVVVGFILLMLLIAIVVSV